MWIANSFVIGATAVLFLLWGRYVCSLMLAAQTPRDCSDAVARANSLEFASVLRGLDSEGTLSTAQLDAYAAALARDFEVVTYLMRHMGGSPGAESAVESWMLRVDYRVQALWYRVMRYMSEVWARRKVSQMALIICHFADLIGERSVPSRV
ncbi:MAG TPA: hypothetical protein VGL53_22785 [Bryobacteraceae bacterium]|jgi:hypothetical protein